ncbi:MAG: hypothetical protein ACRDVM_05395 [Acidimicrobiia bacterium]
MPYRLVYAGLALALVAIIALGVAFGGNGEPAELPGPIEAISPLPGDSVLRQAVIEVDFPVGYRAELWVDGFRVPDSEITFVEATGVLRWGPSPTSTYLTEWTPGEHTALVRWDTITGLPDTGEFEWTFRVR